MKQILAYILAICLVVACKKDDVRPPLPAGSVSIQGLAAKDTLLKEIPVAKDSPVILNLKAVMEGNVSTVDHIVTFKVDTTRINAYRFKYGNATLLPITTYMLFRSRCRIRAGASISDSVQLNITGQTTLKPETMYVLPVIIQHVDGNTEAVAPQQVLYVVVKTGKSPSISKTSWSIVSVSSVNNPSAAATNLLDNDLATSWATVYGGVPANVVIDFGSNINFSGVTYRTPVNYYTSGGYPTKLKIEVSTNGTTWVDKGTYDGVTTPVQWSQNIGATTARYMRFNVLECMPYMSLLKISVIADISLIP